VAYHQLTGTISPQLGTLAKLQDLYFFISYSVFF